MFRKSLWVILVLMLFQWMVFSVYAQETKSVIVEGMSSISFDVAAREAQRAAVEKGAGTFIYSESETQDFVLIKDKIFSRTEGYILGYEMLEKKHQAGLYIVKIKAEVAVDRVKDDFTALKVLLETMGRPKLMALIEENYSGMDFNGMRLAETEMISLLQEKGFELVDKAQVAAANKQDQAKLALAGNTSAAKALGLYFGAQYILIGKTTVHNSGEAVAGSGFNSMQASLQVKILHSQSGIILGSVVKQGAAAHISELAGATNALKKAVTHSVDQYIVSHIIDSWMDFLLNGLPIKMNIVGVKSFRQYKDITSFLQPMGKIASCKKEGWNKKTGLLVLDLRFKGMAEELAEMLDQKKIGDGKLSVEDFAAEKIDLSFK